MNCYLSNQGEYSTTFSGVCYNQIYFNDEFGFGLCRQKDLYITGPFTNTNTFIISSLNLFDPTLRIYNKNGGPITLQVSDFIGTTEYYKNMTTNGFDYTGSYTPFVIVPVDINNNKTLLKYLSFKDISFTLLIGTYNNRYIFTNYYVSNLNITFNIDYIGFE